MSCCCGDPEEAPKEIPVTRKCRDILCLLVFIAFWAGMIVVCSTAFNRGNTTRLVYGTDSYGLTCGSLNNLNGTTYDLTDSPYLYYVNALQLLDLTDILFAKTICVPSCPDASSWCEIQDLPCTSNSQFRCPYYKFAEDNLYGELPGVAEMSTEYFSDLASITVPTGAAASFLQAVSSLGGPWPGLISSWNLNAAGATVSGKELQLESNIPGNGPCYPVLVETSGYFHRCIPSIPISWVGAVVSTADAATNITRGSLDTFSNNWNTLANKWTRYVGDIGKGAVIILVAGLGGSILLCLLMLVLLRWFAGWIVWLVILAVNVACIGIALYAFSLAGVLGDNAFAGELAATTPSWMNPTQSMRDDWKWIGIGASIVAGLVLLITLLMITRIRIAVACIKVASQAVGSMPTIVFFPLLPFFFEIGFVIYWIAVTALLYSAGTLTPHCLNFTHSSPFSFQNLTTTNATAMASLYNNSNYNASATAYVSGSSSSSSAVTTSCYTNLNATAQAQACGNDPSCYLAYEWDNTLKYMFIYHFFGLLWTNQVLVGFTCVTIASAISSYYWAGGVRERMSAFPILVAIKNTFLYSMGSIAFAAFILAVIQLIRYLLIFINQRTQSIQKGNIAVKWCMCCVECCLWCLQKLVGFINRNAYIIMGIKGSNYCCAACLAIKLIIKNALRLSAVGIISDVLLFLCKIGVTAAAGLIAFGMAELPYYSNIQMHPSTTLSSPVLPVAISMIIAFIVAEVFFAVYEMAIDTIMLAFCEDCDKHGGAPIFAPPLLMEVLGRGDESD